MQPANVLVATKVGYCTLCRSRCGTLNRVEGGKLVAVTNNPAHPTGAATCAKGRAAPEIVGSPRRLTTPLRRTNPRDAADPGWEPIGWDKAMDLVAGRLGAIRAEHRAEAVAFAVTTPSGTPMVDSFEWVERFVRCFGSPNLIYAVEICGWHKDFAHALTTGRGIGAADYDHADTIVLWGHNPARTWLAQATRVAAARRRGATVVVVDPKRGGSGEDADLWLPIRPGTDAALALGAINHLLQGESCDTAFVRDWTNAAMLVDEATGRLLRADAFWPGADGFVVLGPDGAPHRFGEPGARLLAEGTVTRADGSAVHGVTAFELLRRQAAAYTPAHVARLTGLAPEALDRFYRLFEGAPRLAYHSWTGVGQHTNATQTDRAIGVLYALTGAEDRVGGNIWTVAPPTRVMNDYALLPPAQRAKALGLAELPLGPPSRGWITARDFCRAVTEGVPYPVRALMSFGTNFVVSQGGSDRNLAALRALDFHVHVDMFLNPTAANADIVLPANMPWERDALKVGFEIDQAAAELIQFRQRMTDPVGEGRADYAIAFDLACRLGHSEAFFGGSIEAGWNHQLAPVGLTVDDLRAAPDGIAVPQPCPERKYEAAGFATPTGRVELYSEQLLQLGQPPLPAYVEPVGWDGGRPLRLVTAKSGWFVHSSHRHVASLRRKSPDPMVEISTAAAAQRGISPGDWVVVETAHGRARLRAKPDASLQDDVAVADFGFWEECTPLGRAGSAAAGPLTQNINAALSDDARDPVSGSVPLRAVACEITRDDGLSQGLWSGQRPFQVAAVRSESADVVAVSLRPGDGGQVPDFLPGQHVTVHSGVAGLSRAYSLTGLHTGHGTLDIAVRRIPEGRMSTHLHGLAPGDLVMLEPPGGIFCPPVSSRRPVVLVASGIGITPFVSYIRAVAVAPPAERPPGIQLVYLCRDGTRHPFGGLLRRLAKEVPQLRAVHVFTRPGDGDVAGRDYDRAGRAALGEAGAPFAGQRPLAYICGSEALVADATRVLLAAGLPRFDIFSELFTASVTIPDTLADCTVTLSRSGRAFRWQTRAGTLLDAAEAAGITLPSGCRTGQCESCSLPISAGSVAHLSPYDGPPDHCLTCRSVPLGDLIVDA